MTRNRTEETPEGVVVETGAIPTAVVIWLHGLGADGYDFAPIVQELGLPTTPAIRFVFPHAPQRRVTINAGFRMRAWYDVRKQDLRREEDEEGIRASLAQIHALIDAEQGRGIPAARIVLAGFSQGGAMTLFAGLRYKDALAGLMPLSCYLPLPDKLAAEATAATKAVPILMVHGQTDPIIPLRQGRDSADFMKAQGYRVEFKEYDMPHSVCPQEIDLIGEWLTARLGK
jgi:phospholipase/carboxylesterase